jgi:TfoX/Sxy family transcriptional regulator of competence genes
MADRVRAAFAGQRAVVEKKMMGGLTFMVNGKMCVGVLGDDLMVRLDPTEYDAALWRKGCREMTFTGKPMRGSVFVGPAGTATKHDLASWISRVLAFNATIRTAAKRRK